MGIAKLEGEILRILKSSPAASVLVDDWTAQIKFWSNEFVAELAGRVRQGGSARIKFESAPALVFINSARWLEALPALAELVTGTKATGGRTISMINDELLNLRLELNGQ